MLRHRRKPICLLLIAVCAALCGCSVFKEGVSLFGRQTDSTEGSSRQLPGIPTSRDAMQLEVLFIERPVGDPFLGDALWNEVDQVGSLEPEVRLALKRNGFRAGQTSSDPPRALEQMLDLTSEFTGETNQRRDEKLVGRRIVLTSGGETEVQTGSLFPECSAEIVTADGSETKEFQNARFVFRLKVEREQDGWARLEFLPEIHHGDYRLRQVAGPTGWELRTTQNVVPLYAQRFSLLLNVGEMAIVTTDNERPSSIGRHFFLGSGKNEDIQRLLVVRLSDMTKTDPVYSDQ